MNWKPGNQEWESDLLATDGQSFLLPKPALGLCETSAADSSMGSGTELLELSLHQKLTSLRAGAEANEVSAGRLYLRNDADDQLDSRLCCEL